MNKKEILEKCNTKLSKRFMDMKLVVVSGSNELLAICNSGFEDEWRLAFDKGKIIFRPGHDIHEDLLILANEFRKEYFNVL